MSVDIKCSVNIIVDMKIIDEKEGMWVLYVYFFPTTSLLIGRHAIVQHD
jgi:hypothetical protein